MMPYLRCAAYGTEQVQPIIVEWDTIWMANTIECYSTYLLRPTEIADDQLEGTANAHTSVVVLMVSNVSQKARNADPVVYMKDRSNFPISSRTNVGLEW